MAPRRSPWKTAGVLFGGMLLLAAAFFGWMEGTTSRGWAELRRRSKNELAAESDKPVRRTFLGSPAGPGPAWKEYSAAAAAVARLPSAEQSLLMKYLRTVDPDLRGEVRVVVEAYGDVLELLARGAAAGDPDSGVSTWNASPMDWRLSHVAVLALCAARLDVERGREAEALQRIGQVLQLTRDLLDRRPGQGLYKSQGILTWVREQVGHLLAARRLGPSGRSELERLLGIFEASWPSAESVLRRACIDRRRALVAAEAEGMLEAEVRRRARGLSRFLTLRQQALAYEGNARSAYLEASASDAWEGRTFREFFFDGKWSDNGGGDILIYAHILRQARAEAALRGAALDWLRTGTASTREDPAGTFLLSREEEGGLLLWSVGWNGVDDGAGRHDLVIRVRR